MRDMRITKRVVDNLEASDKEYVAWDFLTYLVLEFA